MISPFISKNLIKWVTHYFYFDKFNLLKRHSFFVSSTIFTYFKHSLYRHAYFMFGSQMRVDFEKPFSSKNISLILYYRLKPAHKNKKHISMITFDMLSHFFWCGFFDWELLFEFLVIQLFMHVCICSEFVKPFARSILWTDNIYNIRTNEQREREKEKKSKFK